MKPDGFNRNFEMWRNHQGWARKPSQHARRQRRKFWRGINATTAGGMSSPSLLRQESSPPPFSTGERRD